VPGDDDDLAQPGRQHLTYGAADHRLVVDRMQHLVIGAESL
jgi:hypothetical protein